MAEMYKSNIHDGETTSNVLTDPSGNGTTTVFLNVSMCPYIRLSRTHAMAPYNDHTSSVPIWHGRCGNTHAVANNSRNGRIMVREQFRGGQVLGIDILRSVR